MLHAGKYDEAETYVQDFYARFTAVVLTWFSGPPDPGLEFFLRDCTFNRGPTGAAHVLQLALKVRDDGVVGSVTRGALAVAKPEELLLLLRRARQQYEYRFRDERSKFWQGLVNRWNKALADAQKFHAQGVQT
jgi:lysozyme family protein